MSELHSDIVLAVMQIVDKSQNSDDEFENLFSSDSSDEEFSKTKTKRTSIQDYFEAIVPNYTSAEFVRHFRINRNLFNSIADKFKASADYNTLRTSLAYSAEKHIAIFLWFAGHEACSFRDLSDRFNVSTSTVCLIISRVTYFLSSLSDVAFKWPNNDEKVRSERFFKSKHGFPNIIGAIDGTHIIIDPPKISKDDYLDRKNNFSICLQGICNENEKFIDIFVGFPGSVHDSRVFKNSFIFTNIDKLCEGYHILGDSAYPCSKFVLTPYRDNGHMSPAQAHFNKCLSSSRVVIEHSFGILKQRFRQLYYCKLRGIAKICHFIRACCVLHNLADSLDLDELEPTVTNAEDATADNFYQNWSADNTAGKLKQDGICRELYAQYFISNNVKTFYTIFLLYDNLRTK